MYMKDHGGTFGLYEYEYNRLLLNYIKYIYMTKYYMRFLACTENYLSTRNNLMLNTKVCFYLYVLACYSFHLKLRLLIT